MNIPSTAEPTVQRDPVLRGDIAETRTHSRGYKTIYDVSITNTTNLSTLGNAAKTPGSATAATKTKKNTKYLDPCKAIDAHFHPPSSSRPDSSTSPSLT